MRKVTVNECDIPLGNLFTFHRNSFLYFTTCERKADSTSEQKKNWTKIRSRFEREIATRNGLYFIFFFVQYGAITAEAL